MIHEELVHKVTGLRVSMSNKILVVFRHVHGENAGNCWVQTGSNQKWNPYVSGWEVDGSGAKCRMKCERNWVMAQREALCR